MINFELVHVLTFLDIANLDKYDCILGMPFMKKHKIILDLGSHEIIICNKMCIHTLSKGEGDLSVRKGQDTKRLHGTNPSSRMESMKVAHAHSR